MAKIFRKIYMHKEGLLPKKGRCQKYVSKTKRISTSVDVRLISDPSDSDRSEIQLDKTDLPAPVWGRGPGTMGGAHPVPPVTVDI